jgi:hypothetical protein
MQGSMKREKSFGHRKDLTQIILKTLNTLIISLLTICTQGTAVLGELPK